LSNVGHGTNQLSALEEETVVCYWQLVCVTMNKNQSKALSKPTNTLSMLVNVTVGRMYTQKKRKQRYLSVVTF